MILRKPILLFTELSCRQGPVEHEQAICALADHFQLLHEIVSLILIFHLLFNEPLEELYRGFIIQLFC